MTATTSPDTPKWRRLHLFTIWNFGVTAPLLTAFARQSVYIHDQQFGWPEITCLLLLLTIVLPGCCCLIDWLFQLLSRRLHGWGRDTVFGVLFGLVVLSLLRPYVATPWLLRKSLAGLLAISIAVIAACLIVQLYRRTNWFRSWIMIASIGLLIFPAHFLWQLHVFYKEERVPTKRAPIENPVPVIMVVFDEFSGTTLMNDKMEIDAERFPNFAKLANCSTWYRNATTVHPRTDIAVPTILHGQFPTNSRPPLASEYPDNLFQAIEATKSFEMAVFEPVSRLCPETVRKEPLPESTRFEKTILLFQTLAAVYPRLLFTTDTPVYFPVISKEWFGHHPGFSVDEHKSFAMEQGLFNYPGSEARNKQYQHFLKSIVPSKRPRFCFLHTVAPHYPWSYLPSGEQYQVESAASGHPAGGTGGLGEDWANDPITVLRNHFRYRLQVGYIDRFIGQILTRLEKNDLLDKCLLIVTADHGVSFRPNHSRRLPDAETLPDIISVPLFIKFPGESGAKVDDTNVESVDILPTIADVLGIELSHHVDGVSVRQSERRPRKTLYMDRGMTVIEPDVPQRRKSVQYQFAIFDNSPIDQPPPGIASHPEWHGRSINSFTVAGAPISAFVVDPLRTYSSHDVWDTDKLVPGFVSGRIPVKSLNEPQAELVLAVNGIVYETSRTFWRHASQGFEFLLPSSVMKQGKVQLYLVDESQNGVTLRPLTTVLEIPEAE